MGVHPFHTNMDYYKIFYYVVKFKSISLAANHLSLTQPSVTKTIQRLEEDLQCKLFMRTKRGVTLTTEGAALWTRVESACELVIAAERELEALQALDSGTINIASMEMGFDQYIIPALRSFRKEYPNIKVRFRTRTSDEMLDDLRSGLIDLAVLITPVQLDEDFESRTIDVFQEVLVVGQQYASLTEEPHTLEELSHYPFISMSDISSAKAYMEEYFHQNGLIFQPDIQVTSLSLLIQATVMGFGIGMIPLQVMEHNRKNAALLELPMKDALPARRALAVTNRTVATNKATQVFLDRFLPGYTDAEYN